MTILDDRAGLDRLSPSPLSILNEAIERFEGSLEEVAWDIWDNADADTFKTIKSEKTREKMQRDLNDAGHKIYTDVIKLLRTLEDEVELEMLRHTT